MATPNDQKAAPKDQRATPVGDFNTQHQSGAQWQHQRAASKGNSKGSHADLFFLKHAYTMLHGTKHLHAWTHGV